MAPDPLQPGAPAAVPARAPAGLRQRPPLCETDGRFVIARWGGLRQAEGREGQGAGRGARRPFPGLGGRRGAGPGAAMRAGGERDWRGASEEWRPRCEWSCVAGWAQASFA